MRQKKLAQRAASAALAACMMFTLSAPALAESTNALMQLSINSRSSIARLNEENSIPKDAVPLDIADGSTNHVVAHYDIYVNNAEVTGENYTDILGNGAMRYDPDTKTLSLNDSYMGNLTIYAPNTTVDLNGGEYSVLQGKLVIEAAADVTLTSTAPKAIFGDVNITCAGKLSITCENIAVDGKLTVNNASSVELIGKSRYGGTVTGAAVFNDTGEVTIRNTDDNAKGAAGSISYNGKDYVYFTTADGGALTDPRITPISAGANYLHIVPSELHSITVPEGCSYKVNGAELTGAHEGQTVTVTAPDKGDHFEFAGWTISPDSVTLNNADKLTATFTMPDEAVTLKNNYNQLYDVTVLKGTATPSFAKEGTEITIEAAERPGYRFERWDVLNDKVTLANKNSNTTTFNMPAGEVQVEAKYKALQSITVNDGAYTVNGATTTEAVKGDKIVATANPAPEGQKFVGWEVVGVEGLTDEQKATSPIEFDMPKNGVELTAQYKTLRNIVVNNGTYTVNGTDDKQAVEGDKIAIKAAERPGYQFVRWEVVPDNVTITGVNNEEATFTMPNENVELKARYNKLYTITVDGGHADVTSALTGKEITVDADVPDGKKFMGWKAEGITLTPAQQQSKHITFFMPEGNVTLTAEYKTLHTVTVIGANDTIVLPDTYIEGDMVTVNAADYGIPAGEFDHWESNDIRLTTDKWQSPTLTFKMVDKNVTLTAVPKTLFTITVTGGTVNGESTTARVKAGDWVTIKAENKGDDWKFIEWKLSGPENFTLDTSQSTVQFQMPSGDVTLEAVQMEYRTVTINNGNDTKVNEKALHGDSITVTADEVDGKRFVGWTYKSSDMTFNLTDEELAKKTLNFTVPEGDVTLTANYKQLYTVTVDGEPAGTVIEGEKVHVKANVPEDHEFVKWTSNVFLNGHDEDAEFDFVMPVPGQNVVLTSETSQLYYATINDQGADEPTQTVVVKAGGTVYLEAAGREGWKFIDWEGDVDLIFDTEDHTKAHFTVPSNTNVTVTAKYMKYRTITVNDGTVNGKTTITDALREQEVEIKAVYDPEEQVFDHWEAEGPDGWALTEEQKGAESFTLTVPKGNVTLTAMYKTLHTVTVINGTAQNGETTFKAVAGEKITLTPNLPDDQEFDCWYSEDINLNENQRSNPDLTFKMRDFDITIKAVPKQLYFVELADADTTANGVSGKVEVKSGEDVTIVAPEREGWKFIRWEVSDNAHLDNATASEAHFTMPSDNVSVTAVYYEYHTITMTDDKGIAYNEKGEEITRAVQDDVITIKAKDREDHEFNRWVITPDNGTLVGKNDPDEATFTMPNENVVVDAKYKHLQGITVNGGAAYYIDGTPVETAKAGETIVIMAEDRSKDGLRFAYWEVNSDKEVNVEGGEKATFEMVNAPVELTAHYEAQITYSNDPAIFDEGVGLHEDIVWEKVGDTVSITAVLDNSTDEDHIGTFPGMTFDYWEIVTPEKLNVTSGLNSKTITFEVPEYEVKLIAHWKDTTTVTPEEPFDPGFPVEPEAPAADGSGAVIGVAAAGAAIWGGYEITTRVILNDLLPEGAAIPTNRGELAMLIWTQKGKPEPAAEPAFTDVSDTELAKAAQWCVEQGLLTAEDGKFEPDGWTPKWRVIQVWNQAFPKE